MLREAHGRLPRKLCTGEVLVVLVIVLMVVVLLVLVALVLAVLVLVNPFNAVPFIVGLAVVVCLLPMLGYLSQAHLRRCVHVLLNKLASRRTRRRCRARMLRKRVVVYIGCRNTGKCSSSSSSPPPMSLSPSVWSKITSISLYPHPFYHLFFIFYLSLFLSQAAGFLLYFHPIPLVSLVFAIVFRTEQGLAPLSHDRQLSFRLFKA
ncbi:hypothetical protein B0T09DRAFT_401360 [Sordaria sp. MPI-SDFR-AT-0083]|nr:hypothetical protein B0T09DRAFT_401360 [Sordaria sp. MPI-SDFR-AT-0083]